MDFSNINELLSIFSKYVTNPNNSNNSQEQNFQLQNSTTSSNSFPEPLNIIQDNVLNSKVHTQDINNKSFTQTNNQNTSISPNNEIIQNSPANPLFELTKFINGDTIKLIQKFLPMINNLKGNNILSNLTGLFQSNKKNNTNPINVVSNNNEIKDIESLIRIDTN